MNKIIYTTATIVLAMGLMGCSGKSDGTYSLDREKTLNSVRNVINQHKSDGKHSAVAVSVDEKNNYILGYAHDVRSQQKAKSIAIQRCKNAHRNKENKIVQKCQIYRLDNKHIRTLK